mmetsp:Transcript_24274/g.37435  ORF Transcript_24274/g.37435 Transcript_24274/m.37435 type:complete len:109 (+) Transcript_24274:1334-1660(+)|eukprot:CAMPEP_0170507624 /NCGR_PEP_ID=MMETSP0208-20121228/59491_1 /TAXON_ID=197538 /ORGANISM="Strombidium inclinatum, Strain S3" /LENGTH=108 /DNA_ID=CAMNT_0010789937 /DNA_START=1320 /DNA_END=1646 /DNA_ORIENTATION=-
MKSRNSKQSDLFCQAYLNKLYSHTEDHDEFKRQAEKVTLSYMALSMDNLKKRSERRPEKRAKLIDLKAVYTGPTKAMGDPQTKFSMKGKLKSQRKHENSLPDIHSSIR